MFLLDTNVISELRRPRPHGAVLAWFAAAADADLHISVMTIAEIQAGIEITREQDAAKAAEIEAWLVQLAATWNVIAADTAIMRRWAQLMHRRGDNLLEDALIAATADVHRLTVVTRNVRDFAALGVATLDPFRTNR